MKIPTDTEIRQKALEILYKSKHLSNTNIDCFTEGYKTAFNNINNTPMHIILLDLKSQLDKRSDDMIEASAYLGYGADDSHYMRKQGVYSKLSQLLNELIPIFESHKEIL